MGKRICLLAGLLMVTVLCASNYEGRIILKVNGHNHYLHDIIGQYVADAYCDMKDAMEDSLKGTSYEGSTIKEINLNDRIAKISYSDSENPEAFNLDVFIKDCDMKVKRWITTPWSFNLHLYATLERNVDSLGLVMTVSDAEYELTCFYSTIPIVGLFFDMFVSNTQSDVFDKIIGKTITLIPISTFNSSSKNGLINELDEIEEAERVLQSFPFNIGFNYFDYDNYNILFGYGESYQALQINLDLMPGYYESGILNSKYSNHTPEPVTNPVLEWGGFGLPSNYMFKYISVNYNLTYYEAVDTLFNMISSMGLNYVRINAIWNMIVYSISNINSSLDYESITMNNVDDYIDEINTNGGWDTVNYIIQSAINHELIPYVIVGGGHQHWMPKYNGKYIAPGTQVRSNDNELKLKYVAIPKNAYKYWLKLYTMAVVRKFSQEKGVTFWQAENELNAARFTETYDWWRKGDAWADDEDGGFQDSIAQILYEAIKEASGENESHVIQDFHMFTLSRRMETWRDWYDIVGLNFYPNSIAAYPVLGFMNGEMVWSTRRILKYLGNTYGSEYEDKDVWLIETAYGGKYAEGDITFNTFLDSCRYYYSYERQAQFLEESLNSCAQYGAKTFNWLLPITPDNNTSFENLSDINKYCGLYDNIDNPKPSRDAFENAFATLNDGETVIFTNKYNTNNIGGTLSILNVLNGFPSGSAFKLSVSRDYILRTDKEWLPNQDTTAFYKHHNWNGNNSEILMIKPTFNYYLDGSDQVAQFQTTFPVHFSVDIGGENRNDVAKSIKIRDPWYVDTKGTQPSIFVTLDNATDTTIYRVFLNQIPDPSFPNIPVYTIKAPYVGGVNQNNIYVFDHWQASGGTVDFVDGSSALETRIVVIDPNITIQAVYQAVNQIPDFIVDIPSDEKLVIPPDSQIECAEGFGIDVYGELVMIGQPFMPVILQGSSSLTYNGSTYTGGWRGLKFYNTDEKTHEVVNVIIKDAITAIDFIPVPNTKAGGPGGMHAEIKQCIFENCDASIRLTESGISEPRDWITVWFNTFANPLNGQYETFYTENINLFLICNIFSEGSVFIDNIPYSRHIDKNIFYNCTSLSPVINTSNYNTDHINYTCNPEFINMAAGNYNIRPGSPAIDAGIIDWWFLGGWDDQAFIDPDSTVSDIGALYFPQISTGGDILHDMTWYGSITVVNNISIPENITLTILPGTQIDFSPGKQLTVQGSLIAEGTEEDSILFTSTNASPSAGDWNGIIFEENATGSLKYCNIHYAQYGVKCNQSDPNIHNNTLTHNNYGINLYCASPDIKSNRVTSNTKGLYAVSSSPYIFNNIFSGNSYYGAGFNNSSSPDVYKNSFNSNFSGVITHDYSAPKLGPWNSELGSEKGLNVIADNYRYGLLSDYYSTPFLGSSDSYNMRIGGYNSIYGNPYNVDAGDNACVEAEYNWWGSYPPDTLRFRISNDSEFHYSHYLTYNPGGGSTLSKAASTLVASGESGNNRFAGFDPKKPNPNRLSDLWLWGYDLFINNKQADAIEVYKQLISKFSGSRQAGNALVKIYHMSRNTGREDLSAYLSDIIQNPEISGSLKPVALSLLAGDQLFRNEAQKAVQTYETILNRYPDTKDELHALYSLVLAYHINLNNTESAMKYLSVMKSKYPDEEMTLMAREEMGEKVKWSLAKGGYRDHSDEKTPAIPEEYALRDNYPNPFNPYTTLAFDLPEEARVTVTLYDITGRQVITLTRDEAFPAGFHQVRWDGQNAAGRPVSSGVYLYAMKTSTGFQRIKKMVMVK